MKKKKNGFTKNSGRPVVICIFSAADRVKPVRVTTPRARIRPEKRADGIIFLRHRGPVTRVARYFIAVAIFFKNFFPPFFRSSFTTNLVRIPRRLKTYTKLYNIYGLALDSAVFAAGTPTPRTRNRSQHACNRLQ